MNPDSNDFYDRETNGDGPSVTTRGLRGSTGPRTTEGKRISSMNAFIHGLTGQLLFMTTTEHDCWLRNTRGYFDFYKPVCTPEEILVQAIADDQFRLNRGRAFENAVFALSLNGKEGEVSLGNGLPEEATAALGRAQTWLTKGGNLSLITLYMTRIERSIERNEKQLVKLQTERKALEMKALDEAKLMAEAAWEEGRCYDHAIDGTPGGFVYSNDQLALIITRERALARVEARREGLPNPYRDWEKPLFQTQKAA